jgi:hypothetical protein
VEELRLRMSKVKSSVHQTLAELFQQVSTGKLEPSEFEQKLAFLDGFTGGSSAEVASKPVSYSLQAFVSYQSSSQKAEVEDNVCDVGMALEWVSTRGSSVQIGLHTILPVNE